VGLLDASLGYDLPELHGADWRLTAFGRNITGERYIATALGVANLFAFGAVNNAAIWGLELSTSF
jgi:outer membrane receptor protein involved in Fe transport